MVNCSAKEESRTAALRMRLAGVLLVAFVFSAAVGIVFGIWPAELPFDSESETAMVLA